MKKTIVLAALVADTSMPALAGGIAPSYDPTWPQRLFDTGYQLPPDVVKAAPVKNLDPNLIEMSCNADFALAQIVPDAPYSITVTGLPTAQYKIAVAHYGRVYQDQHGVWFSARDRGVQIRGAPTSGTQHFKIVYSRSDHELKVFDTDDFYLTTTCK